MSVEDFKASLDKLHAKRVDSLNIRVEQLNDKDGVRWRAKVRGHRRGSEEAWVSLGERGQEQQVGTVTGSNSFSYKMTQKMISAIHGWGEPCTCARCGKPLEEGQEVWRKQCHTKTVRYHLPCWDEMFLEC